MSSQQRLRLTRYAVACILFLWPIMPLRLKAWAFLNDPDDGGPERPFDDIC